MKKLTSRFLGVLDVPDLTVVPKAALLGVLAIAAIVLSSGCATESAHPEPQKEGTVADPTTTAKFSQLAGEERAFAEERDLLWGDLRDCRGRCLSIALSASEPEGSRSLNCDELRVLYSMLNNVARDFSALRYPGRFSALKAHDDEVLSKMDRVVSELLRIIRYESDRKLFAEFRRLDDEVKEAIREAQTTTASVHGQDLSLDLYSGIQY